VDIRWGDADVINPPAETAPRYLEQIPGARGRSLGPDVEHHHLFPDSAEGVEARTRAADDAVGFFRQSSS
jgi:hypothetical protein